MFGLKREKANRVADQQEPSCSFCKRSQNDVRKLIAGPTVFICDQCVQVCVDILASDARLDNELAQGVAGVAKATPVWTASARCTLCRMPVVLEEALGVQDRALLCQACVSAIQAAAAEAEDKRQAPE